MKVGHVVAIIGDASIYGIPCAEMLYGAEIIGYVVEGAPGMPRYEDHEGNELGVIFDPHEQSCDRCLRPVLECEGLTRDRTPPKSVPTTTIRRVQRKEAHTQHG